jgi:hypothetical protein
VDDYEQVTELEKICEKQDILPIEALLKGLVPDSWLPYLLFRVWPDTNHPLRYAGTDTYVRLFERAGCVQSAEEGDPPIVIYRGTCTSEKKEGRSLSWTRNFECARHHAHSCDGQLIRGKEPEPTIWCAEIPPGGILAEIDYEVVVNPRRLRKLHIHAQEEQYPAPEAQPWPSDEPTSDASEH